jgi:hypothetical protein
MKTRFGRAFIAILSVAALAVGLSSCSWLLDLFGESNTAPTVSLNVSDSSLYSDDIASFTATAYDADGDSMTYTWYVNGSAVSGSENSQSRYWLTSSTIYPEVYVVVDDGYDGITTSNTVYMTISPAASFRVVNSSGATIYYVQVSTTSGSSWSADYLGNQTLPNNYTLRVTGLSGGYYYMIRATDYYSDTWTSGDVSMYDGYYRNFTLSATSWIMSAASNSYSSLSASRALDMSGISGSKQASSEAFAPKAVGAGGVNYQIAPTSAEESDPNHDPALGYGVIF